MAQVQENVATAIATAVAPLGGQISATVGASLVQNITDLDRKLDIDRANVQVALGVQTQRQDTIYNE